MSKWIQAPFQTLTCLSIKHSGQVYTKLKLILGVALRDNIILSVAPLILYKNNFPVAISQESVGFLRNHWSWFWQRRLDWNICKMSKRYNMQHFFRVTTLLTQPNITQVQQHKVYNSTSWLIFQSSPTATSPARRLSLASAVWDSSCPTSCRNFIIFHVTLTFRTTDET